MLDTDDPDIDTIADAEVEKIILDITQGKLKDLPSISQSVPSRGGAVANVVSDDEEDEPLEDMTKRLEALKS